MKARSIATTSLPVLASLSSLSLAAALALPETRRKGPGFVAVPFTRTFNTPRRLQPRDNFDVDVPLFNVTTISYLVDLSIGTPGQPVKVAIDTGSSELWVNPNCKTVDTQDEYQDCVTDGQYNPDDSSTFVDLDSRSSITYGIGKVELAYLTDDVALPSSTIDLKNIQFGAAIATQDLSEGIIGLGFGNASQPPATPYANFVDQLFLQGATQSRAFSVALGNQDLNDGGVLVLGGLDTGKFSGELVTMPILGPQLGENIPRYWVELQSIGSTINGRSSTYANSGMAIVIDTGSTLCSLPSTIVQDMIEDTGAQVDTQGDVVVKCSFAKQKGSFNFAFNGITISVPFSQFVYPIPGSSTECILGISATNSVTLLGDSFLRSAYVVFDQDNKRISMAPWADCGEHQQPIGPGPVEGIQGACNQSSNGGQTGGTSPSAPDWTVVGTLGMLCFLMMSL